MATDPPRDRVLIEDLRVDAVIGVYEWERGLRQTLSLDVEMAFDNRRAATSDRIDDTLDYKRVAKRLIQYVGDSSFQLVETLAERCAEILLREFGVPWLRLRIRKLGAVRGAASVGVEIVRQRDDPR